MYMKVYGIEHLSVSNGSHNKNVVSVFVTEELAQQVIDRYNELANLMALPTYESYTKERLNGRSYGTFYSVVEFDVQTSDTVGFDVPT